MATLIRPKFQRHLVVTTRYPVSVATARGFLEGETRQINQHGALVRCQPPPKVEETVTVCIHLPERQTLTTDAQVVRVEFEQKDDKQDIIPCGILLRFANLSHRNGKLLHHLIKEHYLAKVGRIADEKVTDEPHEHRQPPES